MSDRRTVEQMDIVCAKLIEELNDIIETCATTAEYITVDRFGKLAQFQAADEIRELKVKP